MSDIVATFHKLDRYEHEKISVEIGPGITALVGPNGAGKSTLLEALAEVFVFFSCYHLRGPLDKVHNRIKTVRSARPEWESCTLKIPWPNNPQFPTWLTKTIGTTPKDKTANVTVVRRPAEIVLSRIEVDGHLFGLDLNAVDFVVDSLRIPELDQERILLKEQLKEKEAEVNALNQELASLRDRKPNGSHDITRKTQTLNQAQNALQQCRTNQAQRNKEIGEKLLQSRSSDILLNDGTRLPKSELESFIEALVPKAFYVHGDAQVESYLSDLVKNFKDERNAPGSDRDGSTFKALQKELEEFLGTEVDVAGEGEDFHLIVSGRTVEQVSRGTHLALCFFAICRHVSPQGLVLWDEPENGMHSTRRNKMRDLMLKNTRRFVIATHQTEFCPVMDAQSHVFKLLSRYRRMQQNTVCTLHRVDGLLDAFTVLESLGLEPSRLLFTSNLVIWVEGPSDAIYLRYWLKQWAKNNNQDFVEGFDFTILFTGGSNLAHHTISSDLKKEVDSIVDVLTVTPTSIFVSDTDLNLEKAVKHLESISKEKWSSICEISDYDDFRQANSSSKETIALQWLNDFGHDFEQIRTLLKPRVLKLHDAVNEANQNTSIVLTHGRETENYLTTDALSKACKQVLGLEPSDQNKIDSLNKVYFDRWDSYKEQLEHTINENIDTLGQMQRVSYLWDKIKLANAHVESSGQEFDVTSLRDKGHDIGVIANKILATRENYRL
jgi:predicted ATP-dependent endonuclease of OLD family